MRKFFDPALGKLAALAASLCATMGRTTFQPSRPAFVSDPASIDRLNGRQIDWVNVGEQYRRTPGQVVVVGAAGAAISAVSVPVLALVRALNAGTVLDFGAGKFAVVTANAAAGAVAIAVRAIPTALVSGDQAIVAGTGAKFLAAGTVVGSLLGSGKVSPRIASTNPAIGILETNATDDPAAPDAKTGYGIIVGGVLFENLLPEAAGGPPKVLASAVKTELAAAGMGWVFQQYSDSRT